MKVSELVVMILLISIVIIGSSNFVGDLATSYSVNASDISYLNQTSGVTSKIQSMHESMARVNQTTENPVINAWNYIGVVSSSLMTTAMLFLESPFLIGNMLTNASGTGLLDLIGIPAWIIGIFITIIVAVVGFAIYRTVSKSDI